MSASQPQPGSPVGAALRAAIRDHGPISFAEFMEIALYGPGGFYESARVGERGDFVTSPHVHPVFGRLLARGLRECWELLGRPDPFPVVELGAGDGTLARQLMEGLREVPVRYIAVERSPGARARLAELPVEVAAGIEAIGSLEGCVVANELLDNLPFHWVRHAEDGLLERRVGLDDGGLRFVDVPCPEILLEEWPALYELHPRDEAVVSLDALHLIDRLARGIRRGYALLLDYGRFPGGRSSVHGYRAHRVVEDIFDHPGSIDVTAGVDFDILLRRARDLGVATIGPVSQRAGLVALGYAAWDETVRDRQRAMLDERSGREAVASWSERHRASLLVDPAGLGRLRWAALGAGGVPWPGWLVSASEEDLAPLEEDHPGLRESRGWTSLRRTTGRRRRPRRTRCP